MKTQIKLLASLFISLFILLDSQTGAAQHAHEGDSLALVAFYHATNGPNWENNSNWLSGQVKEWHGVVLDDSGRVTSLILNNNGLSGTVSPELGNLSKLRNLQLANNRLSESIPKELRKLSALQTLYLGYNQLEGSIPPELGELSNLERLHLRGNQLSETIPVEFGKLTMLQDLNLFYNQISGIIPAELKDLSNLLYLDLSRNELSGIIPPELGRLNNLQSLRVNSNQLSGSIPAELGGLANLLELNLSNNQLVGTVPPEMGNLKQLLYLYLENNQLSGGIPPTLGNLTNLKRLFLKNNQLTGNIPLELGNLSKLEYLRLSSNKLTGNIPSEFGNLTNLLDLSLSYNHLNGSIPGELGKLSSLKDLLLNVNQLTDNIPPELGNLSNLQRLALQDNQLEGSIPAELINLSKLYLLFMGGNNLHTLPDLSSLNGLNELYVSNLKLTFKDLVPNKDVAPHFRYIPQKPFSDTLRFEGVEGQNISFGAEEYHYPGNVYQWKKDGKALEGQNGHTLNLTNLSLTDAGEYHLEVTNPELPDLTLHSEPFFLTVIEGAGTPELSHEMLTFGFCPSDQEALQGFTLRNVGSADLEISKLSIDNLNFNLADDLTFPLTVLAGDSLELTVRYIPSGLDQESDTLYIISNPPDAPNIMLGLIAGANAPGKAVLSDLSVNESLEPGASSVYSLLVENSGTCELQVGYSLQDQEAGRVLSIDKGFAIRSRGMQFVNGLLYSLDYPGQQMLAYNMETGGQTSSFPLPAPGRRAFYGLTWDGELLWTVDRAGKVDGYDLSGILRKSFMHPYKQAESNPRLRRIGYQWRSEYHTIAWNGGHFIMNECPRKDPILYAVDKQGNQLAEYPTHGLDGRIFEITYVPAHDLYWATLQRDDAKLRLISFDLKGGVFNLRSVLAPDVGNLGIRYHSIAHNGDHLFTCSYFDGNLVQLGDGKLEWLRVEPGSMPIPGGEGVSIDLKFDASGLAPGVHGPARLQVETNDTSLTSIDIPVSLTVSSKENQNKLKSAVLGNGLSFGEPPQHDKALFSLYPNPASGKATIRYRLTKTGSVLIKLTNVGGRAVNQYKVVNQNEGGHQQEIKLSGIPKGLYFVELHTDRGKSVKKLIVE